VRSEEEGLRKGARNWTIRDNGTFSIIELGKIRKKKKKKYHAFF
jgi:hypothetical protein